LKGKCKLLKREIVSGKEKARCQKAVPNKEIKKSLPFF